MARFSHFKWFNTSPESIRLAVMLCVRTPLSLRNLEDLLQERRLVTVAIANKTAHGVGVAGEGRMLQSRTGYLKAGGYDCDRHRRKEMQGQK